MVEERSNTQFNRTKIVLTAAILFLKVCVLLSLRGLHWYGFNPKFRIYRYITLQRYDGHVGAAFNCLPL